MQNVTHKSNIPFCTWTTPLPLFLLGTCISYYFEIGKGLSMFYLPAATVVVLLNWWGFWRVFPAYCINAVFALYIWTNGGQGLSWLSLKSCIPEIVAALMSWALYSKLSTRKFWIPNVKELLLYLALGVMLPVMSRFITIDIIEHLAGTGSVHDFSWFLFNWQGDFTFIFVVTLPLLHIVTPIMARHNLLLNEPKGVPHSTYAISTSAIIENAAIYLLLLILSLFVPFSQFWYVFGSISFYVALRFGFKATIIVNVYIMAITYVVPSLYSSTPQQIVNYGGELYYIFLGSFLLCTFAALTGRTISDLRAAETQLAEKNRQLEQANTELDNFVYSISHDISAPLKTMQGLIHLSRVDPGYNYLDKFENSIIKLDEFLVSIIKVAENKKHEIKNETVKLKELCREIVAELLLVENTRGLEVKLENLDYEIKADKTRLKTVLNNIIANSMKYTNDVNDQQPYVKISSACNSSGLTIKIEDNGEGIEPEVQNQIFNMFYRGNEKSKGPGLGLYIAHQTVEKIGGQISVESVYGKGSVFTINLPLFN